MAKNPQIRAEITAQDRGASQTIQRVDRSTHRLREEVERLSKETRKLALQNYDLEKRLARTQRVTHEAAMSKRRLAQETAKASREQKKFTDGMGLAGRSFRGFNLGAAGAVASIGLLGAALAKGTKELVLFGEQYQAIQKGFQLGGGGIATLRRQTQGFLTDRELMRLYNFVVQFPFQRMRSQMGEIIAATAKLAVIMGQDVPQSVENMLLALGRGSSRRLDNLGLILKQGQAEERYAKQLGKTRNELTEQEKAYSFAAIGTQMLLDKVRQYEDVTVNATKATTQLKSSVEELKGAFGNLLEPAFISTAEKINMAVENMTELLNLFNGTDAAKFWAWVMGIKAPEGINPFEIPKPVSQQDVFTAGQKTFYSNRGTDGSAAAAEARHIAEQQARLAYQRRRQDWRFQAMYEESTYGGFGGGLRRGLPFRPAFTAPAMGTYSYSDFRRARGQTVLNEKERESVDITPAVQQFQASIYNVASLVDNNLATAVSHAAQVFGLVQSFKDFGAAGGLAGELGMVGAGLGIAAAGVGVGQAVYRMLKAPADRQMEAAKALEKAALSLQQGQAGFIGNMFANNPAYQAELKDVLKPFTDRLNQSLALAASTGQSQWRGVQGFFGQFHESARGKSLHQIIADFNKEKIRGIDAQGGYNPYISAITRADDLLGPETTLDRLLQRTVELSEAFSGLTDEVNDNRKAEAAVMDVQARMEAVEALRGAGGDSAQRRMILRRLRDRVGAAHAYAAGGAAPVGLYNSFAGEPPPAAPEIKIEGLEGVGDTLNEILGAGKRTADATEGIEGKIPEDFGTRNPWEEGGAGYIPSPKKPGYINPYAGVAAQQGDDGVRPWWMLMLMRGGQGQSVANRNAGPFANDPFGRGGQAPTQPADIEALMKSTLGATGGASKTVKNFFTTALMEGTLGASGKASQTIADWLTKQLQKGTMDAQTATMDLSTKISLTSGNLGARIAALIDEAVAAATATAQGGEASGSLSAAEYSTLTSGGEQVGAVGSGEQATGGYDPAALGYGQGRA